MSNKFFFFRRKKLLYLKANKTEVLGAPNFVAFHAFSFLFFSESSLRFIRRVRKIAKSDLVSSCLSVRSRGTARLPLDGFS